MAVYNKHQQFVQDAYHGVYNFSSDQLMSYLTAAANPPLPANSILTDLTQIDYTNLSSRNMSLNSSSQTAGLYRLILNDLVLTASGPVATFRYAGMYNDTPTAPLNPLVSWWDYGADVTLQAGETFTYDFDATNGVLQHS